MNLGEITEDYSVSVNVIKGNASATFTTTPAFYLAGNLYVHPFKYAGRIINFAYEGLSFELSVIKEGEVPCVWKNVTITREIHGGEIYHAISASTDGVRVNRRNSFRVFVGTEGEVVDEETKEKYTATIKDISTTGIAIIPTVNKEDLFPAGRLLQVKYVDEDFFTGIDVKCRVVRSFESDVGQVYGCQFVRIYPKVEHYVAMRQVKRKKR